MEHCVEFLEHEPGTCSVGSTGNLMIVVWTGRATGPAVELVARASARVCASYPQGFSGIHLIVDKVSVPTPEARTGLVKMMFRYAEQLACIGVVVGGTGFWASAMRSFLTGMRFMTPRSFDFRLHGSIEELFVWLPSVHAQRTGVQLERSSLARLLESAWTWPDQANAAPLFERPDDPLQ